MAQYKNLLGVTAMETQHKKLRLLMTRITKIKHQIKSNKYYVFWGACTIAVVLGQIYVGAGYRRMSQDVKDLTEVLSIKIELDTLRQNGGFFY